MTQTDSVYPSKTRRGGRVSTHSRYDQDKSSSLPYPKNSDEVYIHQRGKVEVRHIRRISVAADFKRIKTKVWPEDLQPSRDTVDRAERLWSVISHNVLRFDIDPPRVAPAEDNSVDFFWGNKSERILMNVPSETDDLIFLHYVNEKGQTIINFTDSHTFNVANLVRELRGSFD